MAGQFFVIDGTDGSGKKTQIDLLEQRLQDNGITVHVTDFPRYGAYSATFVEHYLNGHYGSADEVSPKQASLFYALDRYAASKEMKDWLAAGDVIISNRYTSANMGHQCGKIKDPAEQEAFMKWLFELEFDILNIPRPNTTFFLHVPHHIGMELVKQKTIQRDYIEGGKEVDIHEEDKNHLMNAEASYVRAAAAYDDWTTVTCAEGDSLRSIPDIHEEIWSHVAKKLGLT